MQEQMVRYFAEEKAESWLFVLVGVAAIALSVWLVRTGSAYRGMAWPLVAVGLIQIAVGGAVLLRTDGQVAGLLAELARSPEAVRAAEVPRMEVVMRNFQLYKVIEIALLVVGIVLTYAFRRREVLYGVGVGLVLQSSVMLVLDLFAEKRGDTYLEALQTLPGGGAAPVKAPGTAGLPSP